MTGEFNIYDDVYREGLHDLQDEPDYDLDAPTLAELAADERETTAQDIARATDRCLHCNRRLIPGHAPRIAHMVKYHRDMMADRIPVVAADFDAGTRIFGADSDDPPF